VGAGGASSTAVEVQCVVDVNNKVSQFKIHTFSTPHMFAATALALPAHFRDRAWALRPWRLFKLVRFFSSHD
jgi:hypothetical protein